MADKTITYRLSADITAFTAKMGQAAASVKGAANEMTGATAKGESFRRGLSTVGTVAGGIGLAAAAGLGAAIGAAANFDQAMSGVQAATHESAANMDKLRAAAIKAGADTAFSASEAAQGIEALAKAGVSTKDVLGGGLRGALSLAAAGEIDVGTAAEDAATAMTQFGLHGKDVPHVADLLAAAAGKAQGEVQDFSMALNQSGLVAHQTGLSIEETTGALAAFASQGLIGSDAGTSLKTFLLSLSGNSTQAKELMDKLGFSAYNAQGKFVGLTEVAGRMRETFGKLTDEQRTRDFKQIFGTDAIRAANVLYTQGADGIQKWITKVDDSGFAAQTAAIKMDNLKGDLEQLGGSLETALIGTGEGAQGPLRSLVQNLTGLVNAYSALPQPVHNAAAGTLGFVAATGGGLFVISRMVSGISSMRATFSNLGEGMSKGQAAMMGVRAAAGLAGVALLGLGSALAKTEPRISAMADIAGGAAIGAMFGPWGAALGAAGGALKAFADHEGTAAAEVKGLTSTLDAQTGAITKNTTEWALNTLQQQGVLDTARTLGVPLSTIRGAVNGNATDIAHLNDILDVYKKRLGEAGQAGVKNPLGSQAFKDVQSMQGLIDAIAGETAKVKESVRSKIQLIAATHGLTYAQAELVKKYKVTPKDLKTVIHQVGMKEAERGLATLVKGYHLTPDEVHTVIKQIGMKGAVDLITSLDKKYHLTKPQVQTIIKQIGMGKSQADIAKLLHQYGVAPKDVPTIIRAIDHASGVIDHVRNSLASLHDRDINVRTHYSYSGTLGPHDTTHNTAGATGGLIRGPGTATSDSIPAMVSDGEYIVRAAAVSKYGADMLHSINAMRYAGGGMVGASPVTNSTINRGFAVNFNGPITTYDVNAMARATETRFRDALALAASP